MDYVYNYSLMATDGFIFTTLSSGLVKEAKNKNSLPGLDSFMKEVLVGVILSDG